VTAGPGAAAPAPLVLLGRAVAQLGLPALPPGRDGLGPAASASWPPAPICPPQLGATPSPAPARPPSAGPAGPPPRPARHPPRPGRRDERPPPLPKSRRIAEAPCPFTGPQGGAGRGHRPGKRWRSRPPARTIPSTRALRRPQRPQPGAVRVAPAEPPAG